jgi:hypothetical protein
MPKMKGVGSERYFVQSFCRVRTERNATRIRRVLLGQRRGGEWIGATCQKGDGPRLHSGVAAWKHEAGRDGSIIERPWDQAQPALGP